MCCSVNQKQQHMMVWLLLLLLLLLLALLVLMLALLVVMVWVLWVVGGGLVLGITGRLKTCLVPYWNASRRSTAVQVRAISCSTSRLRACSHESRHRASHHG